MTAGNASGQNDGAAVCIVTHPERARELGLQPLARLVGWAVAGVAPGADGHRPGARRPRGRSSAPGWRWTDMDLIELNEAFAAQALAVLREWELPDGLERVNVHGSGISLGHPIGATGGRILDDAAARAAPPRRALRARDDVHRRRPGDGGDLRERRRLSGPRAISTWWCSAPTGVTGRQVARYLAERAAESDAALGGGGARRGQARARAGRRSGVRAPELLTADVARPRDARGDGRARARGARPRRPLHALRAPGDRGLRGQRGAHYVDLTGELPFVREMIDELPRAGAREAGVKLVQVCGFEALPADLLVARAGASARASAGRRRSQTVDVRGAMTPPPGLPHASDMVSGGTFQSLAAVAGERARRARHRPRDADHRRGRAPTRCAA